ncbi:hypothetical protein WJX74_003423 [Apatococcus lobatus]|uniref:F-box domain-containing protein n=1 Tax=Apatococcus lobatus TaxID=904363 RepID=A0AAW1QC70_9CHLO
MEIPKCGVQQETFSAIAILGQDELGQIFKHVAQQDVFSLGPCQAVCRLWRCLAQSDQLYELAYKTHIPAPCHRPDLLDDRPGAWKRLCLLSRRKIYRRPSQIVLDKVSTGVETVQLNTDCQVESQHQLLDRNASGEKCLPSFACATWSPQGDLVAFCKLLYGGDGPRAVLTVAEPDGKEVISMPLSSNPLVLAWASCGTRLAILEGGGPPLELSVLDVMMSIQRKQRCRVWVARDVPLFFCWAPDRPSLVVCQSSEHMRYDLLPNLQCAAHRIHSGFAGGMVLQWATNPKGEHYALLEVNDQAGQAEMVRLMSMLLYPSHGEESAAPSQLNVNIGQDDRVRVRCCMANPDASMACWIEDHFAGGRRLMACLLDEHGRRHFSPWQLVALQGESVKAFQWSPNGERILVISKWQHLALPDPHAEEQPANAEFGLWVVELRANSPGTHVVSYGRCKPCDVFCNQLLTFWSQYSMCLPLWSPNSLAFCYAASHTDVAAPHGPAMLHLQQIDAPSQCSPIATFEKLEGLASGAISAPDTRTTATCSARVLGPADHVTWCPGSSWSE